MSYNVLERTIPSTGAPHAVDELSARLPGKVAVPGDPGWDETRMGWIRSVDQQPCAVVTVTTVQDVVEAVRFAARNGLSVAAQPVGHGATAAVNGTILLRTRGLQDIHVDAQNKVARVGAGVKWANCSPSPASTASPDSPAAARTPRWSASASVAGSAGLAGHTAWRPTE